MNDLEDEDLEVVIGRVEEVALFRSHAAGRCLVRAAKLDTKRPRQGAIDLLAIQSTKNFLVLI